MKKLAIAALVVFGTASAAHAAGDATAGKDKSATCVACHGADGNSVVPTFPKLAGQHESYIVKQLSDFHDGKRSDPTMTAMAAPLSEQDMADLAAFSSQSPSVGSVSNAELAEKGKKIYTGGNQESGVSACMACHGPSGAGNPAANFPALSGQHATYIKKALTDFRSGTRSNDINGMMGDIAAKMSDAEIDAVAEYITALH
jgi:cytochrome c553